MRKVTIYREDSTTKVVYERVKHLFWLADNSVLCIAQYTEDGEKHHYINWLREHFVWYRDEPGGGNIRNSHRQRRLSGPSTESAPGAQSV